MNAGGCHGELNEHKLSHRHDIVFFSCYINDSVGDFTLFHAYKGTYVSV